MAIYRPYVLDTAISWELEVPTVDEMAARITAARQTHEWLVLEHDARVIGYAYGHALYRVASYQWAAQTGIYVDAAHHRAGGDTHRFRTADRHHGPEAIAEYPRPQPTPS